MEQLRGNGITRKANVALGGIRKAAARQHHAVVAKTDAGQQLPGAWVDLHCLLRIVEGRIEHGEVPPQSMIGRPVAVSQAELQRQARTDLPAILDIELAAP